LRARGVGLVVCEWPGDPVRGGVIDDVGDEASPHVPGGGGGGGDATGKKSGPCDEIHAGSSGASALVGVRDGEADAVLALIERGGRMENI
jgi:hypothetical protein